MSTRRARIKAVASLPPRRKNVDNGEATKKEVQASDNGKKAVKSPRTPRGVVKAIETMEKRSPSGRTVSPLKSPPFAAKTKLMSPMPAPEPQKGRQTPKLVEKVTVTPTAVIEPQKCRQTPKLVEKISVITPTAALEQQKGSQTPKLVEKISVITPTAALEQQKGSQTPKLVDHVSVITPSAASIKHNVFISPQSPLTKVSPAGKPKPSLEDITHKLKGLGKRSDVTIKLISNKSPTETAKSYDFNSSNVSKEPRCDIPDADYNVPSVPESLPEDTVMDGIVPLQSAGDVLHPIALLKNEIISEHAEVLFDPIVPLPSPSKVRPKLKPVPRLAPLRRNSIQGSASESEDENKRALLNSRSETPRPARIRHDSQTSQGTTHSTHSRDVRRVRNDSVSSCVSQAPEQSARVTSPVKEKNSSKSRRQESTRPDAARRLAAMRHRRQVVKRDTLTMYDLIFYNPINNPFVPDQDEIKAKEENEKAKAEKKEEEEEDDPPASTRPPVPQVKLGPNGQIVLDEASLVIKQSAERKVTSVVREGAWVGHEGKYRRATRTAEWTDPETVRFYRALAALGTDFSLMEPLFPGRKRRDLKLKFKKEEKINGAQIDKALRTGAQWDATRLQREFDDERKEAVRRKEEERAQQQREARKRALRTQDAKARAIRTSRGTKALDYTSIPVSDDQTPEIGTADSVIQKMLETKERAKKKSTRLKDVPKAHSTAVTSSPDPYSDFATLTLINNSSDPRSKPIQTIPRVDHATLNLIPPVVPQNIESGSLVVLTVNDPNSPAKKMMQTYIARGAGRLTPVDLPSSFLSSVVGYMKKSTQSTSSSPQLVSPASVASHDSLASSASNLIQCSPAKRVRHSSFSISQL